MASRRIDTRTVEHFVRRLRRVSQHPLAFQNGDYLDWLASVPTSLSPTKNRKAILRSPLPDEVAFESLATRLRPLVEPKDDLYFEKAFRALERLIEPERDQFRWVREYVLQEWRAATERSDRTRAYSVTSAAERHSDVQLAFSWLYGDSIHGDHKKVETLDITQRFKAAVGFFSGIAVMALATLNLIRQLDELGVVDLPERAFTDDVVVTASQVAEEVEAYFADVGVDLTADVNAFLRSGKPLPPHIRPMAQELAILRASQQRAIGAYQQPAEAGAASNPRGTDTAS